jgi:hypothetical protein
MKALNSEHAIVSGSVALYTMLSVTFNGDDSNENGWYPNDIDVYVPLPDDLKQPPPLVTYMMDNEGYHTRTPVISLNMNYPAYPSIQDVIYLKKGNKTMDIIVSANRFSISPIFHFHSTPVMNCITGNGIFSAYPKMTCQKRRILNPLVLHMDITSPPMPYFSVRAALKKYEDRGFQIRRNPSCWSRVFHLCTRSINCPHTTRQMEDWGCLYLTLRSFGKNTGISSKSALVTEDIFDGQGTITWHFGGDACDSLKKQVMGYVRIQQECQVRMGGV